MERKRTVKPCIHVVYTQFTSVFIHPIPCEKHDTTKPECQKDVEMCW